MPDAQPSVAGTYQAWVDADQRHTFEAEREHAARLEAVFPDIRPISLANRHFLTRAVATLAKLGVDQFLDLGAGRLHRGTVHEVVRNVHEVAQEINPAARIVYVDVDPVTAEYGKVTVSGTRAVEYLHADVRDPQAVLGSVEVARCGLDLGRPIAVLMAAMVQFIADEDDPAGVVGAYRDASAPGSYLVISHATTEHHPQQMEQVAQVYNARASLPITMRDRAHVAALMAGYDLLEPGVVNLSDWRPEPGGFDPFPGDSNRCNSLAAVGRRR